MRWFRDTSALLACALLISCANTKPFEKTEQQKIQKGKTTYGEVVKMFGEPKAVIRGSNGKKVAVYNHLEMNPSVEALFFGSWVKDQGEVEVMRLDILFDPKERVEKCHFSKTATDVTSKRIDQASAGKVVTPEKVAKIKKAVTRKQDLLALLGPPNEEGLSTEGELVQYWWYSEHNTFDDDRVETLVVCLKNDVVDDFAIKSESPN